MKTRIGLIIGIVIAAIIVAAGILFATADTREYNKLLKLGDKYISELDYDNAIATYKEAIKVAPKREEAYVALAEAYEGNGDFENEKKVLEKCLELVRSDNQSEDINKKLEYIDSKLELKRAEEEKKKEEAARQAEEAKKDEVEQEDASLEKETSGEGFTDDELCEMAKRYYSRNSDFVPPIIMVDNEVEGRVAIHLFEIVDDHTATYEWYYVNRYTAEGEDLLGNPIDLKE